MEFTDNTTIDAGFSITTISSNIIGITAPLISGAIISAFANTTGYIIVFCISLLAFTASSIISFKIPPVKTEPGIDFKIVLKLYFTNKSWIALGVSDFLRGAREGVMSFLLGVLIFLSIQNEMMVGVNSFACSIISLLSFMYLTKKMTPKNRMRAFLLSAVSAVAASLLLFLGLNIYTIFIFSIISSIAVLIMQNSSAAIGLTFIRDQREVKHRRIESVTVRETYINSGRVLGIASLFFFEYNPLNITLLITALYVLQIVNWMFLKSIKSVH